MSVGRLDKITCRRTVRYSQMAFPTTRWTQLADATLNGDAEGRAALADMCEKYRKPVLAWLLSRGLSREAAEDLAQDFFLKVMESRAWKRADQVRGRFRTFLLAILHNLMKQTLRGDQCLKRGGGVQIGSLDALADDGVEIGSLDAEDAAVFDREWAIALLERAVATLETEQVRRGRQTEWSWLRRFLPGVAAPPAYEDAAAELNLSLTALKAAVHRLRQRFREALRSEVARTVATPHEIDEELRYLGSVLMGTQKEAQLAAIKGKETLE